MDAERWTDEELIQVYDLQEKYTENIVDFVRNGAEKDVYDFLQVVPELNSYYLGDIRDKEIFRKAEFMEEYAGEEIPRGRYVYKDCFDKWQGADTLREIFEEKYQWDFAEARPETLALFADKKEIALETYSVERYEKLREKIPQELLNNVRNFIYNYPLEIQEKAFRKAIYGYTNGISNGALMSYRREHMPEFEKVQLLVARREGEVVACSTFAAFLRAERRIAQDEVEIFHGLADFRERVADSGFAVESVQHFVHQREVVSVVDEFAARESKLRFKELIFLWQVKEIIGVVADV